MDTGGSITVCMYTHKKFIDSFSLANTHRRIHRYFSRISLNSSLHHICSPSMQCWRGWRMWWLWWRFYWPHCWWKGGEGVDGLEHTGRWGVVEWLKGGLIHRPGSIIRSEKVCAALPSANIIHHSSAGQRQTMKACMNFRETSSGDFRIIFIDILITGTLASESWRWAQGSRFEASRSRLS